MANSIVNKITMNDLKNYVGRLAQTNYYQVHFSDPKDKLKKHLENYADFNGDTTWVSRNVGLLCADASLPTSSFATSEVKDNFMGVTQEFAHTRLYTDIDFTFYVDNDYKMLRFFEGWMDFISGTSEVSQNISLGGGNYYRRMNYPNDYKVSEMYITKFERDYGVRDTSILEYTFINAFPKGITAIPVAYGPADLLKVSVSFNYDRYIVKKGINKVEQKNIFENPQFGVDTTGELGGQTGFNITRTPLNLSNQFVNQFTDVTYSNSGDRTSTNSSQTRNRTRGEVLGGY